MYQFSLKFHSNFAHFLLTFHPFPFPLALVLTGRLFAAISFVLSRPALLRDVLVLASASAAGQVVIYHTISEYGALSYSTIMTVRQFCSLLISQYLFARSFSIGQWVGTCIVFGALLRQGTICFIHFYAFYTIFILFLCFVHGLFLFPAHFFSLFSFLYAFSYCHFISFAFSRALFPPFSLANFN